MTTTVPDFRGHQGTDPGMRFVAKIEMTPDEHWLWRGYVAETGYGKFCPGRPATNVYAHRWVYQQIRGPIPEGFQIDHLCRVRHCVNPWHLEAVTQAENIRRSESPAGIGARLNRCRRGHELPSHSNNGPGKRTCAVCRRISTERYEAKRRSTT